MNPDEQFDLRHYAMVLRKRYRLIVAVVVACVLAAVVVSFAQPKVYSATSEVLLSTQQQTTVQGETLNAPNQFANQVGTQAELVESAAIEQAANEILGDQVDDVREVSASGVSNTFILSITATSEVPEVAQAAANAYSDAYLQNRQESAINRVLAVGETVADSRTDLENEASELERRISELPAGDPSIGSLEGQQERIESQISELQNRYDEAQANALVRDAGAESFAAAELPEEPTSPQPVRNIALAFVLGALLGVGAVLLIDRLDDRLRRPEDLEQWLPSVPNLGSVPNLEDWRNSDEARVVTLRDPHSPAAEAYRALRTNIEFMALDRRLQVIQVSSAIAGEGKSATAANLAVAMAWAGKRVVVVAGDLRRPRLHEFFRLSNETGITSIMLGGTSLDDSLQKLPIDHENAHLLSTGPLPPNPAELLANGRIDEIFDGLRERADYVIVDSAPLLPVADSLVLARHVDGVILAARAGVVRKAQIEKAASMVANATNNLVGVVLNGISPQETYSYGGSYYRSNGSATVELTESRSS
jgi:polysaccharide biosynthesis transport protein